MALSLTISDRDDLIALGDTLGAFIKASTRTKPWVVAVEGPLECGKSLIPLAVDRCFRPDRYQGGIAKDVKADDLKQPPVVFQNFMAVIHPENLSLDDRLSRFKDQAPNADVYMGSNVITDYYDSSPPLIKAFHEAAIGDQSALLDMTITIEWRENMHRDVTVAVRDVETEENFLRFLVTRFDL